MYRAVQTKRHARLVAYTPLAHKQRHSLPLLVTPGHRRDGGVDETQELIDKQLQNEP